MTPEQIIKEFNREHFSRKDVLFIKLLRKRGLDDIVIAAVILTLEEVCPYCWDAPLGCQCWNDE